MKFFRITHAAYGTAAAAFSGAGAAKADHRWSWGLPNTRAVYCSDTLALACLECLVHIKPYPSALPQSIYYEIDIPDDCLEIIKPQNLPKHWNNPVAVRATRDYGTKFLVTNRNVGLIIPTAIVPKGNNVLINPRHTDFSMQWISGPFPFSYDPRLS